MFASIYGTESLMAIALAALAVSLYFFSFLLIKKDEVIPGNWLPLDSNPQKKEFEIYALSYSVIWISVFALVIVTQTKLAMTFLFSKHLTIVITVIFFGVK